MGVAAERCGDANTREALAACIDDAGWFGGDEAAEKLRSLLAGPPVAVLPERPPPRAVSGFTVRRPAEKISRNAPCPCGSGKKYKKCCMKADEARLADPSPVAGLTMNEYIAQAGQHMSLPEFDRLRPQQMQGLDLPSLPSLHLVTAVRKFTAFAFWQDAERALDVLAQRTDLPGEIDGYREDLIGDALAAGAVDVALHQAELLDNPAELYAGHRLGLDLATSDATVLAQIEEQAALGIKDDAQDPLIVPYSLLRQYPALGLLLARGCLDPARELDSVVLLDAMEEARDRLQLPPGDPFAAHYDVLADRHYDDFLAAKETESLTAQNEALAAELGHLRQRLDESATSARSLETSLREATARLAEAERSAATPPPPSAPAARAPGAQAAPDRAELRRKVDDLKRLVRQGNEERAALRRQLASGRGKLQGDNVAAASAPAGDGAGAETDADDLETDLAQPIRQSVLLPVFHDRAQDAIRGAAPPLASQAIRSAAGLAAGDAHLWHGVKQLRSVDGIYSARVGIHHRLLFELEPEHRQLTVLDFILRRDLDRVLARYR